MYQEISTFRDCLETAYRGRADYFVYSLDINSRRQSLKDLHRETMEQFTAADDAKLAIVGRWHDADSEVKLGLIFLDREEFRGNNSAGSIMGIVTDRLLEMAGEMLYHRSCRVQTQEN